jgi:hypothetical protein
MDAAPIASGRDADVFAIDARRVLRRYRNGGDVAAEATVMAYVAALGFPVPAVYEASGADLVMERVTGPTMLSALIAGDLDLVAAAALLGRLRRACTAATTVSTDPDARVLHLACIPQRHPRSTWGSRHRLAQRGGSSGLDVGDRGDPRQVAVDGRRV